MAITSVEDRILEVAKSLFTQRGFSNVAVRDICRGARVNPPTLYYYFKNKETLFEAVVRQTVVMEDFIDRLTEESSKADGPASQIRVFIRTYLSTFPAHLINVGLYVRDSTELNSVGARTLAAELDRVQSILLRIARRGIASGEFRDTDPRMAVECLLGMMNRFIFQQIHFRRRYRPPETASYVSDFFLTAMRTSAEQRQE